MVRQAFETAVHGPQLLGLFAVSAALEPPRDLAAQFSDAAVEQDGVVRQRMSAAVAMRPADGVLMNPGVFLA
ncbi:MAG: hypothetical protein BWZ10_01833 [candidate division BRC1 bacterium ADurb.BinA364]|nr:MAG: hypothetical protein BWZ10_01833 [candidate division BRC1 bacterium ADurb.BinA364]